MAILQIIVKNGANNAYSSEMFGAEKQWIEPMIKKFMKICSMINDFKEYFKSYGQTIYENPSPETKMAEYLL